MLLLGTTCPSMGNDTFACQSSSGLCTLKLGRCLLSTFQQSSASHRCCPCHPSHPLTTAHCHILPVQGFDSQNDPVSSTSFRGHPEIHRPSSGNCISAKTDDSCVCDSARVQHSWKDGLCACWREGILPDLSSQALATLWPANWKTRM